MTEQMIIIRAIILFLVLNYHIFFLNLALKFWSQYSFPMALILTVAAYT